MGTHDIRTQERDSLARFLGWFSIGLGTSELLAPRLVCRAIGASPQGRAPLVMRAMGIRELGQGTGILLRPRPTGWVRSRIAGDALDLSALGIVAARNPGRRLRTALAVASVLPIAVADVVEARNLSHREGELRSGKRIRKAVTIAKARPEVEQAWADAAALRLKVDSYAADVSFLEAPRSRGTELALEFTHDPPAGDFSVAFEKLTGRDLATQLADDLRRFKAQVETGEIVRSDSTPDGHLRSNHLRQRAAQPVEQVPG